MVFNSLYSAQSLFGAVFVSFYTGLDIHVRSRGTRFSYPLRAVLRRIQKADGILVSEERQERRVEAVKSEARLVGESRLISFQFVVFGFEFGDFGNQRPRVRMPGLFVCAG